MRALKFLLYFILFAIPGLAQEPGKIKFGDVSKSDLETKVYTVDSSANAVVIADIGNCSLIGNAKGWFSLVTRHFKRMHILNKNGFDIADVSIPIYKDGPDETKLDKLKAATYNLVNGRIVESKLEGKAVFSEKLDKNWTLRKFTFPNAKEGSIIEFEYTTISDFIQFPEAWEFQGSYPRLWSEYSFVIPSFFTYVFLQQGYLKFAVVDRKDGFTRYNLRVTNAYDQTHSAEVNAGTSEFRWVVKNSPAMKEENYTSSINNHLQKIQFELSEQREPLQEHQYIESWPQVTAKLLASESFGQQFLNDPPWLDEITGPLVKGVNNKLGKAKRIYQYVQRHFTCTDHSELWMEKSLRELVRTGNGSVSEINLLLVALLRHVNIDAHPVMLSTRNNGSTFETYPILAQFNYVIAFVYSDNNKYFLDATEPALAFGRLPLRCYNEHARIVNEKADSVRLSPDSLTERRFTSVFLANEKGTLTGTVKQIPGYYESVELRNQLKEKGKEAWFEEFRKSFGMEAEVSKPKIDSIDNTESELVIYSEIKLRQGNEDIIYLNPLLGEGYKENPFKAATRLYPVEMPYTIDDTYTLLLEIPEGYEMEEMPKETMVKLNTRGDGFFEYRISQSGSSITLRSRVCLKRSRFEPEEYDGLREFFNLIVQKQAELIVFKKKK